MKEPWTEEEVAVLIHSTEAVTIKADEAFFIPAPFGPNYPALPQLAHHRRIAKQAGAVAAMSKDQQDAYGLAVLESILTMQRAELNRTLTPSHRCPCASGTWETDGNKILKAVRQQIKTACAAPMRIAPKYLTR